MLDWTLRDTGEHAALLRLHAELLRVRAELAPLRSQRTVEIAENGARRLLQVRYGRAPGDAVLLLNFGSEAAHAAVPTDRHWQFRMDTAAGQWHGPHQTDAALRCEACALTVAPHAALLLMPTETGA